MVDRPIADGLPTFLVTRQLKVERRTGKVCRLQTNILPLYHATNHKLIVVTFASDYIECFSELSVVVTNHRVCLLRCVYF